MKDQNKLLAWLVIALSFAIFTTMLASFEPQKGSTDIRPLLVFSYLIPIGIAALFFGTAGILFVTFSVVVFCVYAFARQQYLAIAYSAWPTDMGISAYIAYLLNPIFTSGAVWQLLTFFILACWTSVLSWQLKKQTEDSEKSVSATQGAYVKLEDERQRFLTRCKKYDEDLSRSSSLLITLSDLAKEIPSILKTEDLLKLIMYKTVELLSADSCAIFSVDMVTNKLVYACSIGYDEQMLKSLKLTADEDSGIIGWCAKTGKFLSMKEAEQDYNMADVLRDAGDCLRKFPVLFCQPVVERGSSIAVICVGEVQKRLEDQEFMRLVSLLANLSTIAIENAKLMEKTREQAMRDGLTGLYNHRHFYEVLEDKIVDIRGKDLVLAVFLIDIDHFKKFNDSYGHLVGDLILQEAARLIDENTKETDISARYGGEEFTLICLRKDKSVMKELAEALRKTFEQYIFESGDLRLKVTISVGAAFYDPRKDIGLTASELVKRSDEVLYKAKEAGRNRVRIWEASAGED